MKAVTKCWHKTAQLFSIFGDQLKLALDLDGGILSQRCVSTRAAHYWENTIVEPFR